MMKQILVSGFGGQGVLAIGKILAEAAVTEGKEVCFLPAYGAEMRGGSSNVTVSFSDAEIRCPIAVPGKIDVVAVLNKPSLERFQSYVKTGGTLIVNTDLISETDFREDVTVIKIPANSIAEELGNGKAGTMVIAGAIKASDDLCSEEALVGALEEVFRTKPKLIPINKEALFAGMKAGGKA